MPPPSPLLACLLLLASSAPLPTGGDAHDFHVSRLTVNHDTAGGRLELTLDTFVDDLELALAAGSATGVTAAALDLATPTEHPAADSLLGAYLTRTLRLGGGTRLPLRYLGKEPADDPYALYAYLSAEVPPSGGAAALALTSTFLLDLYDDQQNIVVWQRDGEAVDYDLLTAAAREARLDP